VAEGKEPYPPLINDTGQAHRTETHLPTCLEAKEKGCGSRGRALAQENFPEFNPPQNPYAKLMKEATRPFPLTFIT
jgi:hypothetical protein